jgi:hypothetical protein
MPSSANVAAVDLHICGCHYPVQLLKACSLCSNQAEWRDQLWLSFGICASSCHRKVRRHCGIECQTPLACSTGFVARLFDSASNVRASTLAPHVRATMSRGVLAATNHACHPAPTGGSASERWASGKINERAGPITAKARGTTNVDQPNAMRRHDRDESGRQSGLSLGGASPL